MDRKKRSAKMSMRQQNVMVDYISSCPEMQFRGDNLDKWAQLSVMLNSTQGGAVKPVEQWRRTFIEWKSKVKKKARNLSIAQKKTGGGRDDIDELSEMEKKLISLVGKASVLGDPNLAEGGITEDAEEVIIDEKELQENNLSISKDNKHNRNEIVVDTLLKSDTNDGTKATILEIEKSDKSISTQKRKIGSVTTHNSRNKRPQLLPTALQQYAEATNVFATSLSQLATSIEKLAESVLALSDGVDNLKK